MSGEPPVPGNPNPNASMSADMNRTSDWGALLRRHNVGEGERIRETTANSPWAQGGQTKSWPPSPPVGTPPKGWRS